MKQRNFWTECYRPETEISPRICSSCTPLHKCPPYREIPAPNSRPRTVSRFRSPHDFSLPGGQSSLASRSFSRDKNSSTDRFLSDKRPFPPSHPGAPFSAFSAHEKAPFLLLSFSSFFFSALFPRFFPAPVSLADVTDIYARPEKKEHGKMELRGSFDGGKRIPFLLDSCVQNSFTCTFPFFGFFLSLLLAQ